MKERIESDLLIEPKTNVTGNTDSIWDLPWIWIAIIVLIIAGLAMVNHQLTKNKLK